MIQSVNNFFLGFLQFLLGFSKVSVFCVILYKANFTRKLDKRHHSGGLQITYCSIRPPTRPKSMTVTHISEVFCSKAHIKNVRGASNGGWEGCWDTPPPLPELKFTKRIFCTYNAMKCFTLFTLHTQSATEIGRWLR